jgi:hypothetical protein
MNSRPPSTPIRGTTLQGDVEQTPPLGALRDGRNAPPVPRKSGRHSISQRGRGVATPKPLAYGGGLEPGTGVSEEELAETVERVGARKAPGPEGIPARLCKGTSGELAPRLRRLFDRLLAWGEFPGLWQGGRMVLLPKPERLPDSPSAFRPLCLLSRVLPGLQ